MLNIEVDLGHNHVVTLRAEPGKSFLHLLFEANLLSGIAVCAGSGLCGKCKIRFVTCMPHPSQEESAWFSPEEISAGWRMACRQATVESCRIELYSTPYSSKTTVRPCEHLVIDVGTTSIKYAEVQDGQLCPEYAVLNPQMGIGSDIVSRLHYALSSKVARSKLQTLVLSLLIDLAERSGSESLTIVGNPTMMALLREVPLEGLAYAPYSLPWVGGNYIQLADALPESYVPVMLSPFIGADITTGIAYLYARNVPYPYLLADLGTNGEFVLALSAQRYITSSVPLGPALEGVGLSCGAIAGKNVATYFEVTSAGLLPHGGAPIAGISGTGYVSLLAALKRLGLVDVLGHFKGGTQPLARKIERQMKFRPGGRVLMLGDSVFLTEKDIEEFLKAKAAVNVAVQMLLAHADLNPLALENVYVAGSLGQKVSLENLIDLGFFPQAFSGKVQAIGNSALQGAYELFKNDELRLWSESLPKMVAELNVSTGCSFAENYFQAMQFVWT